MLLIRQDLGTSRQAQGIFSRNALSIPMKCRELGVTLRVIAERLNQHAIEQ